MIDESREFFFKIGVISAVRKARGKFPSNIDLLKSAVMRGEISTAISFRSQVGMGSSPHDLFGDFSIRQRTSSTLISANCSSGIPAYSEKSGGADPDVEDRTSDTFPAKLFRNS